MLKKTYLFLRLYLERSLRNVNVTRAYCKSFKKCFLVSKTEFPALAFGNPNFMLANVRSFSKKRQKKNEKKFIYEENELQQFFDIDKLYADINRPLENFKLELVQHATLRTSQGAIENIQVIFENNRYLIQDLAEIRKKNPRLYVLDFSAFPTAIETVMKSLQTSELNLHVQQDGTSIFVPIPKTTREHRELLAKKSKLYFVKCKEGIRDVQMSYTKKLKNIENLSKDTDLRIKNQLAALADKQIFMAEQILQTKQEELLKGE